MTLQQGLMTHNFWVMFGLLYTQYEIQNMKRNGDIFEAVKNFFMRDAQNETYKQQTYDR